MDTSADADAIRKSAEAHYQGGNLIWNPADPWNGHKRQCIDEFVTTSCGAILNSAQTVLNAGSGGEPYGWLPPSAVNLDLFEAQVRKLPNGVVGNLERTPFPSSTFDLIVCVGSVLNYVSAIEALQEMNRLLTPRGHVVLHYETSESFEHLGSTHWRQPVARVQTFNADREDTLWVYSREFINDTVAGLGWHVIKSDGFHILSGLGARLGLAPGIAARWAKYDRIAVPLSGFADDQIILAVKTP